MSDSAQVGADFFFAGGALRPSAQSYVHRPADEELYEHLLAGDFCFVLTPRQMGKTSLIASTSRRLEKQGIRNRMVDLTSIGTEVTAEQWYLGILNQVSKGLRLGVDPRAWWQERADYSNIQRFSDFMVEQVVGTLTDRVVIFFDEIDSTLSFNWRDDFFAGIRALYNARTVNPALERLTFALFGVASPADLIKDNTRTPFNIGYGIQLNEFSWEDASVLRAGLEAIFPGQGERIFRRIYDWTSGHPYLTQKLCLIIAEEPAIPWTDEQIDQKVHSLFLAEDASKESNLNFIQQRLLNHPRKKELLTIYGQVVRGRAVRDEGQSILHNELKLYGIVAAKNGYLRPRNRIYENVFTRKWVRNNLPTPWGAIATTTSIALMVLILAGLIYNAVILPNQKQDAISNFYRAASNEKRIQALARLFSLHGFILAIGYESDALDIFYKLPYAEQTSLFSTDGPLSPELCRDQLVVVRSLYGTMALVDVQQEQKNTHSLNVIREALHACADQPGDHAEAAQILSEIDHWLAARKAVDQPDYNSAIAEYSLAIRLNGKNRATSFELARAYTVKGDFKQALDVLEALVARVPANAIEPTSSPLGSQTAAPSKALSATPLPPGATLTALARSLPSAPTNAAETSAPGSTPGVPPTPPGADTPPASAATPTAELPANPAAISGFASDADLINAARRLVETGSFQAFLLKTPLAGSYPALRRFGILKDATSTPTLTNRQEVQRLVNQALLQATVIRATYQVVHFGTGVEAATATAFDREYKGNIATIEALRPTANALRIVLLQQAIQPTLESEATLFAQADTAAASMNKAIQAGPKSTPVPSGSTPAPSQTVPAKVNPSLQPTFVFLTLPAGTAQASPTPSRRTIKLVNSIAFSPDGKTLAAGIDDGRILLWDLSTGQPILAQNSGHSGSVTSIAFSPDGKILASGSIDQTIILWDVASRQPLGQPLRGHTASVQSVAFSPDGKILMSGGFDATVIFWNVATGQPIGQPLTGHKDWVSSVAFSPGGKTAASASADKTIILWDPGSLQQIGQLSGHTDVVSCLAFSPDGSTLVSGSWDKNLIWWDMAKNQPTGQVGRQSGSITSLAFSPDGKYLASGSTDRIVSVWEVNSGKEVARMIHNGPVYTVAFSPDGKTLATGSDDGIIRIWEPSTGKVISGLVVEGAVPAAQ